MPNTYQIKKGWDKESFEKKFANTAKVITDINADIIAIEEIENENALSELKKRLNAKGSHYAYSAISDSPQSAVQVAVLSKYKIIEKNQIEIKGMRRERPILKLTIDIAGNNLIVYANHWKAKTGPESMRIDYARVLMQDIMKLPKGSDYIILGDLNSNYNEFETIQNESRINDTNGITAINDLLKTVTVKNGIKRVAEKVDVVADSAGSLQYNLWMEISKQNRMSETFGREQGTPDNIIIPKAMFDKGGINYIDGSFEVFSPAYLLDNKGRPFRWQGKDRKNQTPDGFSDHLPILAKFSIAPFVSSDKNSTAINSQSAKQSTVVDGKKQPLGQLSLAQIYDKNITGNMDSLLRDCVVVYKSKKGVVVKQPKGRAIFVYDPPFDMKIGYSYDLRVTNIDEYKGLKEIKSIFDAKENGKVQMSGLLLKYTGQDLSGSELQNEVVTGLSGFVSRGKLVYGSDKEIQIYFTDKKLKPSNLSKIQIKSAHIGCYDKPQLIISNSSDFAVVE